MIACRASARLICINGQILIAPPMLRAPVAPPGGSLRAAEPTARKPIPKPELKRAPWCGDNAAMRCDSGKVPLNLPARRH